MDLGIEFRAGFDQRGVEFGGLRNGSGGDGGGPFGGGGGAEIAEDTEADAHSLNDCAYGVYCHLASGTSVQNQAQDR